MWNVCRGGWGRVVVMWDCRGAALGGVESLGGDVLKCTTLVTSVVRGFIGLDAVSCCVGVGDSGDCAHLCRAMLATD